MSITVEIDETLLKAAQAATQIFEPEALVRTALAELAARGAPKLPDPEIYTDERIAEFTQCEAELEEVMRRKGLC